MTFEYHDEDGDDLSVRPMHGIPAVLILTGTNGIAVDLDRVEEVVAGIRDAARTAAARQTTGQDDTSAAVTLATPCDNCDHALNWHSSQANCVVAFCGCGRFRPPAPAVGQPAEAQAADRAAVLREAAELGRELSRQGYSAQEVAARLDRMAEEARS